MEVDLYKNFKKKVTDIPAYKEYLIRKTAKHLSLSAKRLDVAAAQMAHLLGLSKGLSLKDKSCLEIGGGWIFAHSLVMHLLGAKRILITDIQSLARPEYLKQAVHHSSISTIRDILSPYENHEIIRERLNNLLAIKEFNFEELKKLNIEYRTPVHPEFENFSEKFDFVFSNVVLEYFTEDALIKLLQNLKTAVNGSGEMIHTVHLEDHDNAQPFDYLKADADFYTENKYISHSNRIRFSTYDKIFRDSGWHYSYLYKWQRKDADLPATIDNSLNYKDEVDLRTSHFCVQMNLKPV